MQIKAQELKQLHTLLSQKCGNDRESKLDFLSTYLNEEIKSSSELTQFQALDVIHFLRTGQPTDNKPWAFFDKENKKHLMILSLCIQYGWVVGRGWADLNKLGGWLKGKNSPVKKPIKEMNPDELSKIIVALENMVNGKYK